jgi:hypothetical protein
LTQNNNPGINNYSSASVNKFFSIAGRYLPQQPKTMMKHLLPAFALLFIGLTACNKPPVEQTLPDPEPVSTFTRTVRYTNRGTQSTAAYDAAFKIQNLATVENGQVQLAFLANPTVAGTSGDAVVFNINAVHLQTGLAATYAFQHPTRPVTLGRYTYTYHESDGSTWGSITDTKMGVHFEGTLIIDSYDPVRKLMSGTYQAVVKDLINDPLTRSIAAPIDPANLCDVTLTGTFNNVKLQLP